MSSEFIGHGSNGVWARICGRCQVVLSKKNTGELGALQPDCNDCTAKNNCEHNWHTHLLLSNPVKRSCILCGFTEVQFGGELNE